MLGPGLDPRLRGDDGLWNAAVRGRLTFGQTFDLPSGSSFFLSLPSM